MYFQKKSEIGWYLYISKYLICQIPEKTKYCEFQKSSLSTIRIKILTVKLKNTDNEIKKER